jgi:hypothetical protein
VVLEKKEVYPASQPLRVLFMACSPLDIQPVLDFEKEEEIILDVTRDLPVDMDVEETGSLQGLHKCLETNEYDVIHLTGEFNQLMRIEHKIKKMKSAPHLTFSNL